MRAADRERVETLFESALGLEPSRRREFVEAACGGNTAMRDAVLALLTADARASGVLDVPVEELIDPGHAPDRLGAYRLAGEIGRGGMGVVYAAERDDGQFRRRVAIKVLRAGIGEETAARVRTERQILASLDHPNVASLLDGGVTADGRPYLVMEHVDGLPVDVYCERMRLSVPERLNLFLVVARAVDFAHRNLIVHRDLKPSNILVTADGTVKLLDFGVAKLLNPAMHGDAALNTREHIVLTPEYASPEQLRGDALTTTADVYALGVLLYELLTDRRPFSAHEHSLAELVTATSDEAVERPSARVLRAETVASRGTARQLDPVAVARARHTTPARLSRALHGDIDAIVGMALRAEPPRRYGSAELMAQDMERHMQHRRVHAHEGSRGYAIRRLLRRHRVPVAAAVVVLSAVLLGSATALWQAAVADRERSHAELARAQSEQVTAFLLDLFEAADQPVAVTAHDLVRRGTDRIDQLDGQPLVQARVLGALGRIHESIGEYVEGQQSTERALAILASTSASDTVETADLLVQLGQLQRRRGEYDSAQTSLLRARDIQLATLGEASPALGVTMQQLARISIYLGDFAEAERRARSAVELQRRTLGEDHQVTISSLTLLGAIQRSRGNMAGAEQSLREAVALRDRTPDADRSDILNDRFQLATLLLADSAGVAEAESLFRSMLPTLREDAVDDLPFIVWAQSSLADILQRRGDFDGSEELERRTLELRMRHFGAEHPSTDESMLALGITLLNAGRVADAMPYLDDAAALFRRTLGDRHPVLATVLLERSRAALLAGDLNEADSLSALTAAIRRERYGTQSHGYTQALRMRADVRFRLGDHDLAETLLNEALEQATARSGGIESAETRAIHSALDDLYVAWGRPADAARHRSLARPPD